MKLINADTVVHWQSYDDEHETFPEHTGTIAEFLDAMTDEGCPECVNTLPSALQEAIQRIEKKVVEVYGYPKTEYAEGYVNACKAAIKMLKSLSPVDAVEVRHGRWIHRTPNNGHTPPYDECDICGWEVKIGLNFCPKCGAKMDGKDGEGGE